MATTIESSQETQNGMSSSSTGLQPPSQQSTRPDFWRNGAPKKLSGNKALSAWSLYLSKRSSPKTLRQLFSVRQSPVGWGLQLEELSSPTVHLLALLDDLDAVKGKSGPKAESVEPILDDWLDSSGSIDHSLDGGLQCLVVAHLLPRIVNRIQPERWWELLDALWSVCQTVRSWRIDAELPPEKALAHQLFTGELPLTLAYLLPEMGPVFQLKNAAVEALCEGLLELLNGEGLPRGQHLSIARPLLACWTRCRLLSKQVKKDGWSRKAEEQFRWLVSQSLVLSSPAGTPLLGAPHDLPWTPEFLSASLKIGGDSADRSAARAIFSKKLTTAITGKDGSQVPATSDHCEWSGLATLRTEWDRTAPVVSIDYSTPELRLEVWSGPQRLLAGNWMWESLLEGRRLEPVGLWEEVCWFSDDDVDYLELSIDLAGGARLERQILLAREELFLYLADLVIGTSGGQLCHRFRLPMDSNVKFDPQQETREGLLVAGRPVARVLPLALPEWRSDPRIGQLTARDGHLELEQEDVARNLACPLLIDLKRTRVKKPCTWRQLTVAQALENQPPEVAVGYRAQCGKQQWLLYRSLEAPANRTVLGQNLSNECLVGRFLSPSGEVDELLEIEG